ncbi:TetR/AcrR family transcriptional regulator [Alkalihalobacillus pseudalcaliphilus]|uniref:TetR/AcrR family transcriptional regulator n=1 Tax=Alkalihalobacillus pseudalcaliphilus TaxID=79884 RepID=UPI00064DC4C9|nr:TetR/AcrR family transcriptional regulator [Alkalihalobacillus pseudalcaliphilus]KMK75211.1 TetR family transcriptional regulator [Alkalihalobacillus pseudalcaliphilus]
MTIDRRITKSKKALKDALISLMLKNDFKQISITEIVRIANVNRGTFYKHYQYKEDILEEMTDEVIDHLIQSYREPYKDQESFDLKSLNSNAVYIFEHVQQYANFYSLIVHSKSLAGVQQKIFEVIRTLVLEDLIDIIPTNNINKELLASYHSYAIVGMMVEWIQQDYKYSSSYMAEQLLSIVKMKYNNQ